MAKLTSPMEVVFPWAYWRGLNPRELNEPDTANWFEAVQATDVPQRDLGWYLAQGYKQVGAAKDDPNNPPGKLYDLEKDALKSTQVLDDLIAEYVAAYNEGRMMNNVRYQDIVVMYNDALLKTHSHLNRAAAANNSYKTMFLTSLDSIIRQGDWYLAAMKTGALDTFDRAGAALNTFAATMSRLGTGYDEYAGHIKTILSSQATRLTAFTAETAAVLAQLEDDYTTLGGLIDDLETEAEEDAESHILDFEAKLDEIEAHATTLEGQLLALIGEAEDAYLNFRTEGLAILSDLEGELTTLQGEVSTQLTALDTAVAAHGATYQGLLTLFQSDYTSHAATTRGLLTGLGATELARINEQFDNLLARSRQNLTDRGFYASALVAQIDARVERERSEAITALNDRLAREQVTHEHQLFGELSSLRDRQLAGEQYLHSLEDAAIKYRAQWSEKLYEQYRALKQTALGIHDGLRSARLTYVSQQMQVRERVFGFGQDAKRLVLDGKSKVYAIREALNRRKTDSQFKLADILRQLRGVRLSIAERDLTAARDVDAFAATGRQQIMDKLNAFIESYASAATKYAAQTIQNGEFLARVRQAAIADHLRTRFEYCRGLSEQNLQQQRLYQYQLDTRNNLAVGLFGFMERREDGYPDVNRMGEIAMGLGDAGATQVIQP